MAPYLKLNYPRLAGDAVKFTYNEPLTGGSPDIELNVVDRGIVPIATQATLDVEIGRTDSPYRLRAGIFEVDRISLRSGVRSIAATGLPLSDPQLRVKKDNDYADYSLSEILADIASRYSLAVFTANLPDIKFSQIAQTSQSDLEFLNSLAQRLGAVFKIENRQLIFTLLIDLEKRPPLFSLVAGELFDYSEVITGTRIYQYIDFEVILFGDREFVRVEDDRVSNGEVITYRGAGVTADDENLLRIGAREKLREINGANYLFEIECAGDWRMIAGSTFLMDNRLAFVDRATHTIDTDRRQIWTTRLNCRYLPQEIRPQVF